ncbi:MAG: mandelate racemase/muconate lactonizing enzyme family protein [Alphaproteobacteria bacterium]|nr:mandelate racemase/muconate lactonizing enzyme family protein [Alphaproteobacteria bacterium]
MPRIDAIDIFYLRGPEILDISDNSQDATLIRISAGGEVGWGECDASPLPSIGALVGPMSHVACRPVNDSVLGEALDNPVDIARINQRIKARSLDLLQANHVLAGVDTALWDLLGKRLGEPVWKLLGQKRVTPKRAYGSQLFGDTAQETLEKARTQRAKGFVAVKFGWGPFGHGEVATDADHLTAAREGLGEDGILLVDAGTVWVDDLEAATARLDALRETEATWLEEPFVSGALDAYKALSERSGSIGIAGGEGAHEFFMARAMIDHGGLDFVQIDAGRMGISEARRVAEYATAKDVRFVNHTFNSDLALSASLQPFAGNAKDDICEYPVERKLIGESLVKDRIARDADGLVCAPEAPGLGVEPDADVIRRFLVDVEIKVAAEVLYKTPEV